MSEKVQLSQIAKAVLARLLFAGHGILTVYLLYANHENSSHWALLAPTALLLIETVVTLIIRKGEEYRYFWPSGFLYIMTIIPAIWIIELHLLDQREASEIITKQSNYSADITRQQIQHLGLSNEDIAKKVGELGLIIGIILGRWLMPRGKITRDPLSALLLGYVGNAADIIELFEALDEPAAANNRKITIAVIGVYTWSIFQFTLVTTATIKDKRQIRIDIETENRNAGRYRVNRIAPSTQRISGSKLRRDIELKQQYIARVKARKLSKQASKEERGKGKKMNTLQELPGYINEAQQYQEDEKIRRRELHGEVFQILVTLFMQDGPFLILRLYLIIIFHISSEMHIFFTCKNAIVTTLLVWRLLILTCKEDTVVEDDGHQREEAATKLHNVQLAVYGDMQFTETGKIQVA